MKSLWNSAPLAAFMAFVVKLSAPLATLSALDPKESPAELAITGKADTPSVDEPER